MANDKKTQSVPPDLKYRRVEINKIKKVRRGKHHELVQGILREMKLLSGEAALEIPLAEVGGVGLANLRSAIHRVCIAEGWTIETLADEKNLYVWKTDKSKASVLP
jgi:hypothetical protein